MTEAEDFDGCRRLCRTKGKHTLIIGACARAPKPEPVVSMSKIFVADDGYPAIGYDSYTVQELADLIEPALRQVQINLGPNALTMLQRGETVGLSGGEYADLAREAAHAIVYRHDRECVASRSGACMREAQSEESCDTEEGECVHGGRPVQKET